MVDTAKEETQKEAPVSDSKLAQAKQSEIVLPDGVGKKHAGKHIRNHIKEARDHDNDDQADPSLTEEKDHPEEIEIPENRGGYRPIPPMTSGKKNMTGNFLSRAGWNYDLQSITNFYGAFRFFGYTAEQVYKLASQRMETQEVDKKLQEHFKGIKPLSTEERLNYLQKKDEIQNKVSFSVKSKLNKYESVVFAGWSLLNAFRDGKNHKRDFSLAVRAEQGKQKGEVNYFDLRRSHNPIVESEMDKHFWQSLLRTGAGALFYKGLEHGIIANAAVITLERTAWYMPTAYDILSKAVNDVQVSCQGMEAKREVADNLVRAIQQMRRDHHMKILEKPEMDKIRPVLEMVAEDIIDRKFGIEGVVFILGGGVINPDDPEQSMVNYKHVRHVGVNGVALEGKAIRMVTGTPSNRIWDARLLNQQERGKGYVAESAQRKVLQEQSEAISRRGPMHADPGSRIDPTARRGSVGII